MKRLAKWLKELSVTGKVGLGVVLLSGLFVSAGAMGGASTSTPVTPPLHSTPPVNTPKQTPHKPVVTTKIETSTEPISFDSQTVDDASLPSGTDTVTQVGVNGVKTTTYSVTYSDGVETSRTQVSEETTTQPVSQITHHGTYVAPSHPSGASAQCYDGTYSYSQHRSGTCSHHGGVAQWL